jgi:hypothetical protein
MAQALSIPVNQIERQAGGVGAATDKPPQMPTPRSKVTRGYSGINSSVFYAYISHAW